MVGTEDPKPSDVRRAAMNLLARREHAAEELRQKLAGRFGSEYAHLVAEAVANLNREGLQSDERFTEAFVNMRIRQGKGPVRIRVELGAKGISPAQIDAVLDEQGGCWETLASEVIAKRFGSEPAQTPQEKARQVRFLQYRGFTSEQIQQLLR